MKAPRRKRAPALEQRLGRRNVYVLPTRPGIVYALVVAAMLIGAINYTLQLGYALAFLVAAVALVAMLQTWRNLAGLVLRAGRAAPVFAGEIAELTLILRNPGRTERFAIGFSTPDMVRPEYFDATTGGDAMVAVAMTTSRRGWHPAPMVRVETRFPLGIWRAWSWWRPAITVLVYPQPEPPGTPLPSSQAAGGDGRSRGRGDEDLAALRPWRDGDSPRRLDWKAMARTASEVPIVREYEDAARGELLLDWHQLPTALDEEQRLSRLTRWVLDADTAGLRYALRLPGNDVAPDAGPVHRDHCLEQLACHGLARPSLLEAFR